MIDVRGKCAERLFGAWAIEPKWFARAVSAVQAGKWKAYADDNESPKKSEESSRAYQLGGPNADVAIISIAGALTKGETSFGTSSTIAIRRAIRQAYSDNAVRAIMLCFDSPGGSISGTSDCADDVAIANQSKPVFSFCEDMCASAAFWIACQARKVFANKTCLVGSIGVYGVLEDTSELQQKAGVKLTLVSSSPLKGLGADGKVTDELISDVQREIDGFNAMFMAAVARGRGMSGAQVSAVSTGQVWLGAEAMKLGLIDAVASFDDAMAYVASQLPKLPPRPLSSEGQNFLRLASGIQLCEIAMKADARVRTACAMEAARRSGLKAVDYEEGWNRTFPLMAKPEITEANLKNSLRPPVHVPLWGSEGPRE